MKNIKILSITFLSLITFLFLTILYLSSTTKSYDKKIKLISAVSLPDLAISTEANYIRHRSLSTMFDIYKDDPDIRVYFPSTFSINEGLHER